VRFVRRILEDQADEGVNEIWVLCAAQSAKTLTMMVGMVWALAEDPGPTLWVTTSLEEAKKFSKSRLQPLLERCAPVADKLPTDRQMRTTLAIYFPGSPLILTGSESPASLQSTPFRWVFLDEARSYPAGALEMVSKRFRSYTHNWKKMVFTTPDREGDAVHRGFLSGNQCRWMVPCPKCGQAHEMKWGDKSAKGGLKWDKNEETYDAALDGYRFDMLAKTIRYQCWNEACDHVWKDTPEDRKWISREGGWEANNPNSPSNVKSYTWNALVPWWASWRDQVREFLLAKKALEWADHTPLKDHINETRGEVWSDKLLYGADDKYLAERVSDYDVMAEWEAERRRFMTVDVQGAGGRHFYYVIRSWGAAGKSRLLCHGIAWSWEELKQKQKEWNVRGCDVAVDSGHWAPEVYEKVVESGYQWKAFKGDDKEFFTVQGKRWLFQKSMADPAIGTHMAGRVRQIELYVWAKYGVLERMLAFLHGKLGDWRIHANTDEEYNLQVTTWDRRARVDGRGVERLEWYQRRKQDHFADCEQQQIVCAAATGLLHMPEEIGELWSNAKRLAEDA